MPSFIPDKPETWLLFAIAAGLLLAGIIGQLIRRSKASACKEDYRWVMMAVSLVLTVGLAYLAASHLLETRPQANMANIFGGGALVVVTLIATVQLLAKGGRFTGRLVYATFTFTAAALSLAGMAKGQAQYSNSGGFALNSTWWQLHNIAVTTAEVALWVLVAAIVVALITAGIAKIIARRRAAAAPVSGGTP